MPAIQVTRCGVPWRSVLENQPGSSPSRLMENQTRVTPSRNVSITVRMDRTANTEMIVAITGICLLAFSGTPVYTVWTMVSLATACGTSAYGIYMRQLSRRLRGERAAS